VAGQDVQRHEVAESLLGEEAGDAQELRYSRFCQETLLALAKAGFVEAAFLELEKSAAMHAGLQP
jgi:hypothetical protein